MIRMLMLMMIYDDSASQFMDDDYLFKHVVNQRTFVCLSCVFVHVPLVFSHHNVEMGSEVHLTMDQG